MKKTKGKKGPKGEGFAKNKALNKKIRKQSGLLVLPLEPEDELLLAKPVLDCGGLGLKYLAGSIARKFMKSNPELGDKRARVILRYDDQMPWLAPLAQGGMIQPTAEFLGQIQVANRIFQELFGKTLYLEPNAHELLVNSCLLTDELRDLDVDILYAFAKERGKIRCEHVNSKLQRKNLKVKRRNMKKVDQFQC